MIKTLREFELEVQAEDDRKKARVLDAMMIGGIAILMTGTIFYCLITMFYTYTGCLIDNGNRISCLSFTA